MLAGHFGAKKMYSLLSKHVWWPNMLGSYKCAYMPALFAKIKRIVHRLPDVERDQMQAKMHLYTHMSAYIQEINNK